MRCTVRHGRKKDARCGVWASDKILFAGKKTCRNDAKKPELNVRFAPASDRLLRCHEMSQWAMCGRLRVGKENLTSQARSVQPCVRPLSAAHITAGHNALRRSGPGQKLAFENALARVGCPDRRIDRLCITCCSPSQPSHHAMVLGAISSDP